MARHLVPRDGGRETLGTRLANIKKLVTKGPSTSTYFFPHNVLLGREKGVRRVRIGRGGGGGGGGYADLNFEWMLSREPVDMTAPRATCTKG